MWKAALMVRRMATMMADPWDAVMDVLMAVRRVADLAVLLESSLGNEMVEQKEWQTVGK
jgi:hypothetical protein